MWYKELANKHIKLKPNEQLEFDAGAGVILVPPSDSRIFLHWINDKGKITNTHALKYSTMVTQKLRIINSENRELSIHQIELPNQNIA